MKRSIDYLQDLAKVLRPHHLPLVDCEAVAQAALGAAGLLSSQGGGAGREEEYRLSMTDLMQPASRGDADAARARREHRASLRASLQYAPNIWHSIPCPDPEDRATADSALQAGARRRGLSFTSRRRDGVLYYRLQ